MPKLLSDVGYLYPTFVGNENVARIYRFLKTNSIFSKSVQLNQLYNCARIIISLPCTYIKTLCHSIP